MNASAQFTAVMRAPLVRSIDGQDVTFPLLTAAELGELGEVIRKDWRSALEKNPKSGKLTDLEWLRAFQEIDEAVLPITEIVRRVTTLSGSAWCIERSLSKQGYTDEQRAAIMDSLSPMELKEIAELVTRIRFLPRVKADKDAGENVKRPLSEGAASPTPEPTGEPSAISSGLPAQTPPT